MKKVIKNEIDRFFHCLHCANEWKNNKEINTSQSPSDYSRIDVGWTKKGVQIWCKRHDKNIVHLDFLKQKVGVE